MGADTAMEMELDAEAAAPLPSSKRLSVRNTIHSNFGDDYIFQIAAKYLLSSFSTPFSIVFFFLQETPLPLSLIWGRFRQDQEPH